MEHNSNFAMTAQEYAEVIDFVNYLQEVFPGAAIVEIRKVQDEN